MQVLRVARHRAVEGDSPGRITWAPRRLRRHRAWCPAWRLAIDGDIAAGELCWVEGTVTNTPGKPVPHAVTEDADHTVLTTLHRQ